MLAEASLIPIDNSLVAQGIDYLRYVDDLVVFANSEIEARKHLYRIADILDKQQRLVLNKQKTQLLSSRNFQAYCKGMVEDRPINDLEGKLLHIIRKYSRGNPYQTIWLNQVSEEDLKAFNQKALEVILDEYLSKEPIDFVRLRWFLRRLTQIGHSGALNFCLNHLDLLTPALADVCHYLLSASINYQGNCAELGEQLLGMLSNELIRSNEYFQISLLSLFARNEAFNHFSRLTRSFDSSSGNLRREIILSARNCDGADWLRELKESFPSMDVWCKQAFLVSAKSWPAEERKFFAKSVREDSILDKILLKWIKER